MGRVLAIDYGLKRVGLAVSDPLKIIAGGLTTVDAKVAVSYIKEYCSVNDVECIIIGLPRQMSGEFSQSYKHIQKFVVKLKGELIGMRLFYVDERFTSKMAMSSMIAGGVKKSDRRDKALVDKVSAAIILQSYLEYGGEEIK